MKHSREPTSGRPSSATSTAPRSSPPPSCRSRAEVCEAVSDVWQPEDGREIILNLPATVEMATPNVYADQIEWFSRQLTRREYTAISPAPAQRPRHRGRRDRAGHDGRRRPRRGLPVRPRRAHRQRLPGDPGHEPVQPGHRPEDRLLRHRRDPSHGGVLHPAAGAPAPPVRRRPRLHRLLRLPPGRDQEGPRGPRPPGRRARASRSGSCRGRRRTSRSTRRTSAAPTRPSSGSTASPARAASPTSSRPSTSSTCRAARRSSSAGSSRSAPTPRAARWPRRRSGRSSPRSTSTGSPRSSLDSVHTSSAAGEKDQLSTNVYVDGELLSLTGEGNGPIAAFVDAHQRPADQDVRRPGARLPRARAVGRRRRHRRGVRRVRGAATRCSGASGSTRTSSRRRSRP